MSGASHHDKVWVAAGISVLRIVVSKKKSTFANDTGGAVRLLLGKKSRDYHARGVAIFLGRFDAHFSQLEDHI